MARELGAYKGRTIYEGEDVGSIISQMDSMATNRQGNKPPVPVVDGSQVGRATNIDVPTQPNRTKIDKANATIQTTQAPSTQVSGDDFANQLFSGIPEEQRNMFIEAFNGANKSGTFTQSAEKVLQNLLGTQLDQSKMKKERARLQEQSNLPELEAELAQITSNYDTAEAARNSRILNEAGGKTTISKTQLANRQAEIQRQYGLQVADNRINELVTAGKINAATKLIDSKLDLKYGDLEAEIELYKGQLDAITPFMNAEQAKQAEQRQFILNQASQEIARKRESEKELELAKATALKNAKDRGASIQQIAQIQDAQSLAEIAVTGFTTSALEKAQLYTESLQQRKLIKDIEALDAPSISEQINSIFQNKDTNTPTTTKTVLAELLGSKAVSTGTKARIAPAVEVLNAVDEFANSNIEGKFTGVGLAGRIKEGIKGIFNIKDPEATQNIQQIDAINLKVQQWASGASLTKQQTDQVNKLTPSYYDSDKQVREKLSGLYNYMVNQAEGNLLTEGINVQFPQVNLFEIRDLYNKATPEQRKKLQELYPQLK